MKQDDILTIEVIKPMVDWAFIFNGEPLGAFDEVKDIAVKEKVKLVKLSKTERRGFSKATLSFYQRGLMWNVYSTKYSEVSICKQFLKKAFGSGKIETFYYKLVK